MPEPNSDAEFLRELAKSYEQAARQFCPQITYAGKREVAIARRLETIADEVEREDCKTATVLFGHGESINARWSDADTNARKVEVSG